MLKYVFLCLLFKYIDFIIVFNLFAFMIFLKVPGRKILSRVIFNLQSITLYRRQNRYIYMHIEDTTANHAFK